VPSPLEVGKNQKFNLDSTFTDIKANTKHVTKMHCISKVVGKETRDIDGKTFDVFVIQNVAEYNGLANGAPLTFGVSGVFAPKLGYWVEKTTLETQRGVVTNKVKFTLQHFSRQDESQE
jgi:hypothetical protein